MAACYYCCMKEQKSKKSKPLKKGFSHVSDVIAAEEDVHRLVEMAWQDRLPFEVIYEHYGITENQLKTMMRRLIGPKAYKRWRRRVHGRITKHQKKCPHKLRRFQGPW